MSQMMKPGPKEMEGTIWDAKGDSNIVEILISHQQNIINSIQFSYVSSSEDEDTILDVYASKPYGEPHGLKLSTVTIKYPEEYLVSVSGEYKEGRLISLALGTNKKRHGPFGRTTGGSSDSSKSNIDEFNYEFGPRFCFGGFHGSVKDGCLHAIGVYVKPLEEIDQDAKLMAAIMF